MALVVSKEANYWKTVKTMRAMQVGRQSWQVKERWSRFLVTATSDVAYYDINKKDDKCQGNIGAAQ